jgi:hypothetical protein
MTGSISARTGRGVLAARFVAAHEIRFNGDRCSEFQCAGQTGRVYAFRPREAADSAIFSISCG